MVINIKKTHENAIIPTRGSSGAAGYDLYACAEDNVVVPAKKTTLINTGLCMAIPESFGGFIFPRSGLSVKQGLRLANCVGVIDSDYRGEVKVALYNDSDEDRVIQNGDRIAQIVFIPFAIGRFIEVSELDDTARGEGGFGSTGLSKSENSYNCDPRINYMPSRG